MDEELYHETAIRTEARAKSNSHRIERLEAETAALSRIAAAVEVLAGEQKMMREELSEMGKKVSDLEHLPVKRFETFLGYLLTSLASLLAGILVTYFT